MSFGSKHGDRAAMLAEVPFFEGFTSDDLRRVVELSDEVRAAEGTVLVDQGDPGAHCYVVLEGTANVYVSGEFVAAVGAPRGGQFHLVAMHDAQRVIALVYLDNLRATDPEEHALLELSIAQVGFTLENELLRRQLAAGGP